MIPHRHAPKLGHRYTQDTALARRNRHSCPGRALRSGPPPPGGAAAEGAQPDVGAGVGELAVEAAGAAQPGPEVEAVLVVGSMAGAAERHDALGVIAAAVLARDDVR